jgi:hypothetical protein
MPERIQTADIKQIDANTLDIDDRYPGAFGFHVNLTCDPGVEWGVELEAAYEGARYPGKPPVVFDGNRLTIYYLPRYGSDLPNYLRFLAGIIAETNRSVQLRNSVLPDEEKVKDDFRTQLRSAAAALQDR